MANSDEDVVLQKVEDEGGHVGADSELEEDLPERVTVDTVEGCLEVDEGDVAFGLGALAGVNEVLRGDDTMQR